MNDLKSILLRDEGLVLTPYECPAGHLTIGVGHNIDANPLPPDMQLYLDVNGSITDAMAFYLLAEDCARARRQAESFDWYHLLTENRQTVIICMIFQMGLDGVNRFKKMINALEVGDNMTAVKEMLNSKWAMSDSPERAKRMAKLMREG